MSYSWRLRAVGALTFSLASLPAAALDAIHIDVGSMEGLAWQARNISVDLDWQSDHAAKLSLKAGQLQLPAPFNHLNNIALDCPHALIENQLASCQAGVMRLGSQLLDRPQFNIDFTYHQTSGAITFSLKKMALAKGTVNISGSFDKTGWQVKTDASNLEIAELPKLLKGFVSWPTGYSNTGKLNLTAALAGRAKQLQEVNLTGAVTALNFSDAKGLKASEKLAADFELHGQPLPTGWKFQSTVSPHAGQLYIDPVFQEFTGQLVKLSADGVWDKTGKKLLLTQVHLDHAGVVNAQSSLELELDPVKIKNTTLKLSTPALGLFYKTYLQPLLIGTAFDNLEGAGGLDLQLDYRREKIASVQASLKGADLQDQNGRFGFKGMNGEIGWSQNATPVQSSLSWEEGKLYKLTLGASKIKMQLSAVQVTLLESTVIPVLDGSLQIESFSLANPGKPEMQWKLSAGLTPISMEAFSAALGWPMMSGKVSGVIPEIHYAQNKLEIGGALLMHVFEGDVVVRNLQMERPFGVSPVLSADVDMDNVDLETLTRTFSFGKIEGKLNGKIKDLRMADWQPAAFDAVFATPVNDSSRHRISQKAVDSLSSLGGVQGALSRSFLRFFEDFSYERLGISCRLQNGVCEMDGVAQAKQGYYIVKGGGIPRIDVVGYARKVNWKILVERLKRVTSGAKPVVE